MEIKPIKLHKNINLLINSTNKEFIKNCKIHLDIDKNTYSFLNEPSSLPQNEVMKCVSIEINCEECKVGKITIEKTQNLRREFERHLYKKKQHEGNLFRCSKCEIKKQFPVQIDFDLAILPDEQVQMLCLIGEEKKKNDVYMSYFGTSDTKLFDKDKKNVFWTIVNELERKKLLFVEKISHPKNIVEAFYVNPSILHYLPEVAPIDTKRLESSLVQELYKELKAAKQKIEVLEAKLKENEKKNLVLASKQEILKSIIGTDSEDFIAFLRDCINDYE